MYQDQKTQALEAWRKLLDQPEIRMDAEEQYDELLKQADELKRNGVISGEEWKALVEEAMAFYAQAIEGVGGGT